jgi:Secretion system C-terminal sorting domain
MQTIVFIKKDSAIILGRPNLAATAYTADTNFNGSGTSFQNDGKAICVLNSDSNSVSVSGLSLSTNYYALIYVVRKIDSVYSDAETNTILTLGTGPLAVSTILFTNIGQTTLRISWTKDTSYKNPLHTTLIYIKQDSTIIQGAPTSDPLNIIADSTFKMGSKYLQDTNTFAIYKGDTNFVIVTGLIAHSKYYVLAYVINDIDSNYSQPAIGNVITLSNPSSPVSGIRFVPTGSGSAKISWIKPTDYANNSFSTLVFVKPDSAVNKGTPTHEVSYYSAASSFGYGTKYQNDTNTYCVYKGDTNFVNISYLNSNTTYHVLIFIISDVDSVYSTEDTISGKTFLPPPAPISSLIFTNIGKTSATISWKKDSSYKNSLQTTLIYIKQNGLITFGQNTNPANVNASSVYKGGARLISDSNAYAVFAADTDFVSISGLTEGTTYDVIGFAVSDMDSNYSSPAFGRGITLFPLPSPVLNVTFTGTSTTAASISWTKPTGYINAGYTTLVFVKQALAVTAGIPNKPVSNYTASALFGYGTKYQNDSLARCVYKGDTNFVNLYLLNNSAPYYVLIYVVRDADSNYTNGEICSGNCTPPPYVPFYSISQINHTNSITGNMDSLGVKARLTGIVYGFNRATFPALNFLLRDNTGGITIATTTSNFGYNVVEGDSILIQGTVSSTRGLATLTVSNSDTIKRIAIGKVCKTPSLVSTLNEVSENDLVQLDTITLLNISDTAWMAKTYNAITKNNDTIGIHVYSGSSVLGEHLPATNKFIVTGMGSQLSSSTVAPWAFNGYFIIPRTMSDIVAIDTSTSHVGISEVYPVSNFVVYPNPFSDYFTANITSKTTAKATVEMMDITGKKVYSSKENLAAGLNTIPFFNLEIKQGVYFIRIISEGIVVTQKLVKL